MLYPMPNAYAKIGDAYWVHAEATNKHPLNVGKSARPMACVAELPHDPTAWTALPRLTSDIKPEDLVSRAMPEVNAERLGREGAWSLRWIHSVSKSATGVSRRCEFIGALPKDEHNSVMAYYRNRQR